MEAPIEFFAHEIEFQLPAENLVADWILRILSQKGKTAGSISYIFCSDEYLLSMNQEHLGHDYYTDILTFPYSEPDSVVLQSDIYISIDRVRENANSFHSSFIDELHRVMIHGVFHLLGQDDHGEEASNRMRQLENLALEDRNFLSPEV